MPADKKTHERTEGAATAVHAKHGNSCSANRVNSDPKSSTSFSDDSTGPPASPCSRGNTLVGNGAAAPKSGLSPLEMRTPSAAGVLLSDGTTSTTTRTTFDQPPLWFYLTEDTNSERLPIEHASYYSSFWWINNKLALLGGLYKQNQGKLWFSIEAILQVVSAPAHLFGKVVRVALWGGFR